MKLNNITSLHQRAPINGKDVNFDFILEELDCLYNMAHGKARHALYIGDNLVEIVHIPSTDIITVISKSPDALNKIVHDIADPTNTNRETDLFAEVFDGTMETHKSIRFYYTNTDVLKCQYKFDYNGKTYEGEFFIDMLDKDIYEGIHEGISASKDFPDELIFSKIVEVGNGLHGYEIQVRLNAETDKVEVTECTVYEWIEYSDGYRENIDTIDNAEITIINIDTNEVINQ